jgi:hypothetical protein
VFSITGLGFYEMKKNLKYMWLRARALASSGVSALFGLFFGWYFVGFSNLFPWNYSWLYSKGDGALTQLGFEFFRKAPLIQWPLTAVPDYVEGSSMILPTENAVANVLGKLFGLVFSGNFQFVGLWIALCFALQGYFGAKLLSRFINSGSAQVFGSLFFVFSPALLFRVGVMNHYHLGAHWMILAALYLYFGTESRTRIWSPLLFVAMVTSVYIAVMLVVLFIAHQAKINLDKKGFKLTDFVLPIAFATFGFWVMGYMSMRSSITGSNFFRLNAISYLNAGYSDLGSFSRVLNGIGSLRLRHVLSEEWEGFQYLGTVVIAGLFLSLGNFRRKGFFQRWREFLPILVAGCSLFVFALSNRIFLFQREISYWWPAPLLDLRQVFRGATRFGWPLYYLTILFAVVQISRFCSAKKIKAGVAIASVLMFIESTPGIAYVRSEFSSSKPYETSIVDQKWNEIAKTHSRIAIYPNFDLQMGEVTGDAEFWVDRWFDLAKFSVDHDLSTNFGYVPRPLTVYIYEQDAQILNELQNGELQPNTVYVIANETMWLKYSESNSEFADAYDLDGYFLLVTKD